MDLKLLEDIGLTKGETKVYLSLLHLGSTKTGPLAKDAKVSSSKVYKILDRLENKGLAGHVIKGKVKYFSAMNPKRILEYIEIKEKEFNERKTLIKDLLPKLEIEQKLSQNKSDATVYEGFNGVTNLFRSVIDELKPGDKYYVLGAKYADISGIRSFFYNHHMRRAKKKIKLYMLANIETKGNLEKTTAKYSEIRYLPEYLMSNIQILFYNSTALIIVWASNPIAFKIQNAETVDGFRKYFETFWKIAKK